MFREERQGEAGLAKIKEQTGTEFTLALDNGNKQTSRYSAGRREFHGYVINPKGVITKVFQGDKKNRAKAAEFLQAIKATSETAEGSASKESDAEGSASKESTKGAAKGSSTKPAGSSKK